VQFEAIKEQVAQIEEQAPQVTKSVIKYVPSIQFARQVVP
jgi:hypothetical protein